MKNLSVAIILTFVTFTTVSAAEPVPPASIHLEIGKDTLALAEPVYLKATIANNMGKDLFVSTGHMFRIHDIASRFSLSLITPDGKEWAYNLFVKMDVVYTPGSKLYFLLPPGKSVSDDKVLWWTYFLPQEYQRALEKLPAGNYKLFAAYLLPKQERLEGMILYSDTVEFVFLPPQWEHIQVLMEMDSLWRFQKGYGTRPVREDAYQRFTRIRDSHTPYSEAAHAMLVIWEYDLDEFKEEKARFDRLYPGSQFESELLKHEYLSTQLLNHRYLRTGKGTFIETDSLIEVWSELAPANHNVLEEQNKIKLVTAEEASDE
ncbi:MAG: hypothetical protein U9Q76_02640 [candidate division WOR-3 bacterium]|nr:hypothetical protein [candidate division WOR-3 bacterium]